MRRQWVDYDDLAMQESMTVSVADKVEISPEVELSGLSRRSFLGVMGSSAALAGIGLQGCVRKPVTKLVPYATRPEDVVEGVPLQFATAMAEGATVLGLVVTSLEGRPIKVDGNRQHPESFGAAGTTGQATVLDLYDVTRSMRPVGQDGAELSWTDALAQFDAAAKAAKGQNVGLVLPSVMSPTVRRLLAEIKTNFPKVRFFRADPLWPEAAMAGAALVAGPNAYAVTHLDQVDVVASFDADFLGTENHAVRYTKEFSRKRKVSGPNQPMNRLYSIESGFTNTGAMADNRIRAKAGDMGKLLLGLAKALQAQGVSFEGALSSAISAANLGSAETFLTALAKDLKANAGKSVVLVGANQPAWVHALGYAINQAVGAGPSIQRWYVDPTMPAMEGMAQFAAALDSRALETVFILNANPAFTAPGALGIGEKLKNVATLIHAGLHRNESSVSAKLHLPLSHFLEDWGDVVTLSGVVSLQQPLIAPLHDTLGTVELLARFARGVAVTGYEEVRKTWQSDGLTELAWEKWLHDGVAGTLPFEAPASISFAGAAAAISEGAKAPTADLEVVFTLDPNILDGRYLNNAWLRELPHPISKVTWDNAALINKATAQDLRTGDLITLTVEGRSLTLPVNLTPGIADGVIVVALGYGEAVGFNHKFETNGFDAYDILPVNGYFAAASIAKTGGTFALANVQPLGHSLTPMTKPGSFGHAPTPTNYTNGKGDEPYEPRMLAFEATLKEYAEKPNFPDEINDRVMADEKVGSHLYGKVKGRKLLAGGTTTDDVYLNGVHQWGMSIDMNTCVGCNACAVACQAENNIPVVGKDQIIRGREMAWIRIDRYFSGSENDPQALLIPMACQHCETAPCEAVCPVKATAHSNEGLNDIAYNRCIGTRYCANNCPFKVRRFNFFNFNLDVHPLEQMVKNPDVTVRFRGVVEKCTYCVQRINRAKIQAKIHGDGRVRDGAFTVACQDACPADCIVFGDLKDETSAISKSKSEPRNYQLLRELNMRARTSYLAKLRNPNPDLV